VSSCRWIGQYARPVALEHDAETDLTELLRAGRPRRALPMERRRLVTEALVSAGFLVAAVALALSADATRGWDAGQAIVLTLLFAAAIRISFDVGAGYTSPVQLVFVPMLLLLPTPWVPLLVCAGWLLGTLPDVLSRRIHPDRLILVPANCWFSIGPALVLVAAGAQTPDWSDWPWYVLALAAQFAFETASTATREWFGRGIAPHVQLRLGRWIMAIDALLAPIGLLAAFASRDFDYAFLLLVPTTGLMYFFSQERSGRLRSALALADAARERQELIAGASHELVTPVAVLTGISQRLDADVDPQRRAEMHAAMRRELTQLRHRIRQFVDYTRLKTDRELRIEVRDTDVAEVARGVADAFMTEAGVLVEAPPDLSRAAVDPDRLQQMLMSLVANAVKLSPHDTPVRIVAAEANGSIEVAVIDRGPGIARESVPALFEEGRHVTDGAPEGAGLGLYLVRELARAHGGDVRVQTQLGAGSRFTLVLPRSG
jgi:signal transduction histidine kinase